jgi:hypothetical protein
VVILFLACASGPAAETLIDELRTVAVLADPPEATAGETVAFDAVVLDPLDEGFEVLTWTCTFTGEDCLETLGEDSWSGLSLIDAPESDTISTDYTVSKALSDALSEEPLPLVSHWTLACIPGTCPVFDTARGDDTEALREELSDPTAWLAELPFEGVSLSLRTLLLSTRSAEERLVNPTVSCASQTGEMTAVAGESLMFDCDVTGDFDLEGGLWGYTTAGGWGLGFTPLTAEETTQEYLWYAPEDGGVDVPVWVVIIDGRGGVGLWSGSVAVE